MAPPKVMNGARAKVYILGPDGKPQLAGIFSSFSYGLVFDAQPVYTLGAFGPREIDYTAQEPVSISASGWRVIGQGAHKQALLPKLQELLRAEYITFTVVDRQTGATIAKIEKVRPTSQQTPLSGRQLTEMSFSFMGILCSDEDGDHDYNEGVEAATQLP